MVYRPIAFHPLSVLLDCPNLTALMEKPTCKQLINDLIDELISVAEAQKCSFPADFKQKTIEDQLNAHPSTNIMYQDFTARRPLEVETFLGSAIKSAKALNVPTPHLNTLYPILSHMNQSNQSKPPPPSPAVSVGGPQHSRPVQGRGAPPSQRPGPGPGMPPRGPQSRGGLDPAMARRPPPSQQRGMPPHNGYPPPTGNGHLSPRPELSRRNSFDDDLEEFGHIALYGDMVDTDGPAPPGPPVGPPHDGYQGQRPTLSAAELALRERELALREREQMLREQELMRSRPNTSGRPRKTSGRSRSVYGDDEEDDDFYVDSNPPPMPMVDVDNFDMMSVTSRRNRRLPSASGQRNLGPDVPMQPPPGRGRHSLFSRSGRNRASAASARLMNDVPGLHDPITDNALMGYSSNRYGTVDRAAMTTTSRANSMTSRMGAEDGPNYGAGAYPPMSNGAGGQMPRRMSTSPDDRRPNGYGPRNGQSPPDHRGYRGGPPPDGQFRQPFPKQQNGYPHQVEQHVSDGVRQPPMMKGVASNTVRSTTGSASASLDSGSGETSAYSSSSSLEKRIPETVTVG
jgi:hypothetical protein